MSARDGLQLGRLEDGGVSITLAAENTKLLIRWTAGLIAFGLMLSFIQGVITAYITKPPQPVVVKIMYVPPTAEKPIPRAILPLPKELFTK